MEREKKVKLPYKIYFSKILYVPAVVKAFFYSLPFLFYLSPYYKGVEKKTVFEVERILSPIAHTYSKQGIEVFKYIHYGYICIAVILVVLGILGILPVVIYVHFSHAEITPTGVRTYIYSGATLKTDEMSFEAIENVKMVETLWGKVFDYGSIMISGKGGGKILLYMVPHPRKISSIINYMAANFTQDNTV